MTNPLSYVDAICLLRRLNAVRNGEVEVDDRDTEIVPILDKMDEILEGLDPSRLPFNRKGDDDDENDLMTLVARAAWNVGWQACIAFNQRNERDLFGGDPIAMVVQKVLAKARPTSPLTPEREWEIEHGPGAYRPHMIFELLAALRYERGFSGRMTIPERAEWRRRQDRLETERSKAEEERDAALAALRLGREKLTRCIAKLMSAANGPPPHDFTRANDALAELRDVLSHGKKPGEDDELLDRIVAETNAELATSHYDSHYRTTQATRCHERSSHVVEIGEQGPDAGRCTLQAGHDGVHVSFTGREWSGR